MERQMADQIFEFGAIRSVPGNDGIEGGETLQQVLGGEETETIKSSGDNGLRGICEANEGNVLVRAPDLGVIRAKRFEGREADDEIPDRTRTNQKASQMNHLL
jgi:hypothetical protein